MAEVTRTAPRAVDVLDATRSNVVDARGVFTLPIGEIINGRYRVQAHLGRGGMGTVYEVHDLVRERPLALKTVVHAAANVETLAMLRLEFRHAAALHHPNAAEVYDFEVIAGTEHCLFTMELVDGKNAFDATQDAGWETVVELVVQLCRCLSYMHSRNLIHCDIKPANLMVTHAGQLKVLDFGISSFGSDVAARGGTPNYLAPELDSESQLVDHRVDIYSAGITTFVLLCRRPAFTATDLTELSRMHAEEPIVFPPEPAIPEWLRAVIVRMCAKRAEDRYANANAVIDAINRGGGLAYELETRTTRESYLSSSRFVGREAELEHVREHVTQRLERGTGPHFLLLGGPSGIGKSRLMREVRQSVQLSGRFFVEANCYDGSLAEYEPIAQAIAIAARLAVAASKELIERHGAELAKILPALGREWGIAPSAPLDRASERARLLDTLVSFFVELAAHTPYVLYVNDLQWADTRSVEVLLALAERLASAEGPKLALVGSVRDDEVEGRPVSMLVSPARITLRPFGKPHVCELVHSMLGIEGLPEPFLDRVFEETAGNPFFAEEVMRMLVDTGTVFLHEGRWAATNVGELSVPERMAQRMLRRVGLLEPGARHLLSLLAAHARPMPFELLCEATENEIGDNERHLAELVERQMVETDERAYRVSHDRMRECVYSSLDAAVRAKLHQRIAIALEDDSALIEERIFELARHAAEARDFVRVRRYGLAAAIKGEGLYSLDPARELIGAILALPLPNDEDDESDPRVAADASDRDRSEALAEIYYLRGSVLRAHGRIEESLREHRLSLRCAERAGSAALECHALSGIAECESGRRRIATALAHHDRIVARASEAGLPQLEALSRAARASRMYLLQPEAALVDCHDAIALARQLSFPRAEVLARTFLTRQRVHFSADLDEATRECEALLEASRNAGLGVFVCYALHYLGRIALHAGRRDEAVRHGREACDSARGAFERFMLPGFAASCALAEESDERAEELLAEGERIVSTGAIGNCSLEFCADAMELRLRQGNFSEVERHAEMLDALCAAEPVPWASFFAERGRALAAFGRGQRSAGLESELRRLRAIAAATPMPFALPAIDTALAGI